MKTVPLFDADRFMTDEARAAEAHLRASVSLNSANSIETLWMFRSAGQGLHFSESHSWRTQADFESPDELCELLGKSGRLVATSVNHTSDHVQVLVEFPEALVVIRMVLPDVLWAAVASKDRRVAELHMDGLRQLLPEAKTVERPEAPEIGWDLWIEDDEAGFRSVASVTPWSELEGNYAAKTREQVGRLMDPGFVPGKGGKLLIFHGAPGTGKSTVIQSLMWQWRRFAELHCIADPTAFLGNPRYMAQVAAGSRNDVPWRVIVLEDTRGLFSPDARNYAGGEDNLGRLLQATDGLLGKSSRSLYLITTNEPVSTFHAAVSRPGRCAAIVEFLPLDAGESRQWLEAHGRADLASTITGRHTIAELYALLEDAREQAKPLERPLRSVGFRGGSA